MARRHGARYVAHASSRGLNAARNTGIDAAHAGLLVFVDDDVEVRPGWLDALLAADASAEPEVGVLTGPIHARFEDHALRSCGREEPPITTQELGPDDRDVAHAWGANMTVRRAWLARAGRFDETRELYGDEQEWQQRLRAAGGRIRYVGAAALDHRRAGDDARLRSLAAAAYRRGAASRRFDVFKGSAPSLRRELRVLAGCAVHPLRYRCANGDRDGGALAGAAAGGARERRCGGGGAPGASAAGAPGGSAGGAARRGRRGRSLRGDAAEARPRGGGGDGGDPDFLSGASGTVRGPRRVALRVADALLDLEAARRVRTLDRAARTSPPRRRVLVLGIERPERLMRAARLELHRTRHEVAMHTIAMGEGGKFEHLNALLAAHPAAGFDWLLVVDDDVVLPRGFLDRFLHCAEDAGLVLAQPAHRLHSHAAWKVTRRRPGGGRA